MMTNMERIQVKREPFSGILQVDVHEKIEKSVI